MVTCFLLHALHNIKDTGCLPVVQWCRSFCIKQSTRFWCFACVARCYRVQVCLGALLIFFLYLLWKTVRHGILLQRCWSVTHTPARASKPVCGKVWPEGDVPRWGSFAVRFASSSTWELSTAGGDCASPPNRQRKAVGFSQVLLSLYILTLSSVSKWGESVVENLCEMNWGRLWK